MGEWAKQWLKKELRKRPERFVERAAKRETNMLTQFPHSTFDSHPGKNQKQKTKVNTGGRQKLDPIFPNTTPLQTLFYSIVHSFGKVAFMGISGHLLDESCK